MSRPGIESGPLRWEANILEKSHSNSLLIGIMIIYSTYERATTENARDSLKIIELALYIQPALVAHIVQTIQYSGKLACSCLAVSEQITSVFKMNIITIQL